MSSRTLAVGIALLAGTVVARADGLPAPAPPPPAVACCQAPPVWTGVYIGAHAGAGWSDLGWTLAPPGPSFSELAVGSIFGGQLGVNYQIHRFLIGAEVSWAGNRVAATDGAPVAPFTAFTVSTNDLLMVAGRFGLVHDNLLLYGKAGYASSNVEARASAAPTAGSAEQRLHGYVVGAGLEMRMVSNLIFGLEYNYINLPGDRFTATAPVPFTADIGDIATHTLTARLSILFGPAACCSEGLLGKY
jgi:opacity protein-like surface antigen